MYARCCTYIGIKYVYNDYNFFYFFFSIIGTYMRGAISAHLLIMILKQWTLAIIV